MIEIRCIDCRMMIAYSTGDGPPEYEQRCGRCTKVNARLEDLERRMFNVEVRVTKVPGKQR